MRSILRHVQNSLVLMSVVLVVLAFQRLESLDVVHNHSSNTAPSSSLWPHPPPLLFDTSESQHMDGMHDRSHHRRPGIFRLGGLRQQRREFHIGLFRFALPSSLLKHTTPPAGSYKKDSIQSNLRAVTKKLQQLKSQHQETKQSQTTVALIVPIDSCSSVAASHAATRMAHSLRNESHIHLYAFVTNDDECSRSLHGYNLLSPANVFLGANLSCLSNESLSLVLARVVADVHAHTHAVMYVPPSVVEEPSMMTLLPALARLSTVMDANESIIVQWHNTNGNGNSEQDGTMSRIDANATTTIFITHPQGNATTLQLVESVSNYCHHLANSSYNGGSAWKQHCLPTATNEESTCRISETISIASSFSNCTMPWIKDSVGEQLLNCQAFRQRWLEVRESVL